MAGTRAARRRATQTALITEARRRFAAEGYTAVRLSDVVEALGVTKGALYHHFTGKHDLFRAVVRQVQQEVGDRVAAAAQPCTTPWEELVAGCEAFLASHSDPEIRRIMLIDAPIVLGWQTWREMDEASSQRLLTGALRPHRGRRHHTSPGRAVGPPAVGGHERGRAVACRGRIADGAGGHHGSVAPATRLTEICEI